MEVTFCRVLSLLIGTTVLHGCFGGHDALEPVIVSRSDAADLHLKAFAPEDAKTSFQLLCKAGKPRRKVLHKVLFVIPHAPPGMPLDAANKYTEDLQSVKDIVASEFYKRLARPGLDHPLLEIADGMTTKEVVADLKGRDLTAPHEVWSPISIRNRLAADEYVAVLIRSPGSKPEWVMSVVNPLTYFKPITPNAPKSLTVPPNGMRTALPVELLTITAQYAMVVTREESNEWAKIAELRRQGKLDGSVSDAVAQGKMLPQSKLLSDRVEIMNNYLVANTSVKESTTDDGQVFAFTLSLNTEPLCRLGRPVDSLVSK